jgi:hypothetical protein
MNTLLYATRYGSHLYGTSTPESDTDLRGIYLPSLASLALGTAKHTICSPSTATKNTKDDVDITLYSLQHYLQLLSVGDTGAIDLLFSMFSPSRLTPAYQPIADHYRELIPRTAKAYVGYCLNQAAKYGIKGSRYGDLLAFNEFLQPLSPTRTLDSITDWPTLTHITTVVKDNLTYISVLGKLHQTTITISELQSRIQRDLDAYGARTQSAIHGIDFKALSHAYRVLLQFEELLTTGFISFPLKDADIILAIKQCTNPDSLPDILYLLELRLATIDDLLPDSSLPETVSQSLIDSIILSAYNITTKDH